jgi:hypothetical protein
VSVDIRYIGPIDRVTVPLPTGGALEVDQGEILTVPDDLGERLLEQTTNWSTVLDVGDATNDELRAELAKHDITPPAKATKAELVAQLEQANTAANDSGGSEDDTGG